VSRSPRSGDPKATLLPEAEAEQWARELDTLALARPKIVSSLDVARAHEAREVAAAIRSIARELADARRSEDNQMLGILLENLGSLRVRALALLRR
jgi:hypothetical protein